MKCIIFSKQLRKNIYKSLMGAKASRSQPLSSEHSWVPPSRAPPGSLAAMSTRTRPSQSLNMVQTSHRVCLHAHPPHLSLSACPRALGPSRRSDRCTPPRGSSSSPALHTLTPTPHWVGSIRAMTLPPSPTCPLRYPCARGQELSTCSLVGGARRAARR
jgi:hypothetical protein